MFEYGRQFSLFWTRTSGGQCKDSSCPPNQKCVSQLCECKDGFIMENESGCVDIDECKNQDTCNENAKCQNTDGSYTCSCNQGYYGNGVSCFPGQCPDSNCPENQKCVSDTTVDCECKEGFQFNSSATCSDVDECGEIPEKCDDLEKCLNTVGSFICQKPAAELVIRMKNEISLITVREAFCWLNEDKVVIMTHPITVNDQGHCILLDTVSKILIN